jgi:hypothetical protein
MKLWQWAASEPTVYPSEPARKPGSRVPRLVVCHTRGLSPTQQKLIIGSHLSGGGLSVLVGLAHLIVDLQPAGNALLASIATGMSALSALAIKGLPIPMGGALALALIGWLGARRG